MSDAQAEHQPEPATPDDASSPPDPLAGDWSEGLPGPVRAHGLPLPHRLGETRLPPPPPEEPLRPMETPWSEPAAPLPDANWSMAPPANSDSPWAVAPQPAAEDWPATPAPAPAADALWSAPAASEPVADWSTAPPPAQPAGAAPSSAAPVDASWSAPPPTAGEDLSPEVDAPKWSGSGKPEFVPLLPGESLAAEEDEAPRPIDESEAASLLRPVDENPAGASGGAAGPGEIVSGEHRVAIHARGGRTRRGSVTDLDLSRTQFPLQPQGGGPVEIVAHSELKAIFFMLAPSETAPAASGRKVRVTFSDGRAIEGHRDGADLRQGFFLIPLDAQKTNTKRIYLAKGAVASVTDL